MSPNIKVMIWIVPFLVLLTVSGLSFAGDPVYTWYYGKQLFSFLQAMNSYVTSAQFVDLWKVVVGFAFIFLLFAVIASGGSYRQSLSLLKFYGVVIVVWYLLVSIPTYVDVIDGCTKAKYENIKVPWAVGKPLSWFTRIEKNVRDGLVGFFGSFLPDAYKENEGCFTGYELLRPAITYQPKDPYLRLSLQNYIKDCIIPSVLAGDIDRTMLVNSNDLWNDVFPCTAGKVCAALTTVYYNSANPDGITYDCPTAYAAIDADLVNEYSKQTNDPGRAWKDIKEKVFGTASGISEADIPVYIGQVTPFLMATSLTAEGLIRQAITIQSLNQVSAEFATAIAYQEAYLNALARINMLDFGRGGTLNAMKGVLETLVVGLTPAFFLLFITPIGGRVFYGWITFFVWLALWSVSEVVTVSLLFLSVGDNQKFDFTLSQIDKINLTFNKAAQISSLMSDYIPLITLFIASGSLYAMTHFATGMSRELRDDHGTKVASTGNFEGGNIRTRGYSDLAVSLANSQVGSVNWNTASAGTFSGGNLSYDVVSTNNVTEGRVSMPDFRVGGARGYVNGVVTEGGTVYGSFTSNNGGVIASGVYMNEKGINLGPGSTIQARRGQELIDFLNQTGNSSLAAQIKSILHWENIDPGRIRNVVLQTTGNGSVLTFIGEEGAHDTLTLRNDGFYVLQTRMGNITVTGTDYGIVNVSGLPVNVNAGKAFQEMARRDEVLSKYIDRYRDVSRSWGNEQRFLASALLREYAEGRISAEELENAWSEIEKATEHWGAGAEGKAGTLSSGPSGTKGVPVAAGKNFLRRVLQRNPKIAKLLGGRYAFLNTLLSSGAGLKGGVEVGGGSEKLYRKGGEVEKGHTVGSSGGTTEDYSETLRKATTENLRYAEAVHRSVNETLSQMGSRGVNFSRDLLPAFIDHYADERGLSYEEALKDLQSKSWKPLEEMMDRFAKDHGFRTDILKRIREKTKGVGKELDEAEKRVTEKTEGLEGAGVSEEVDKTLNEKKEDVRSKVEKMKGQERENIENQRKRAEEKRGEVRDDQDLAKDFATVLMLGTLLGSLFSLGRVPVPGRILRTGGLKGLPAPPKVPPLPGGGKGIPPAEINKGVPPSSFERAGVYTAEEVLESARKQGIKMTRQEAEEIARLANEIVKHPYGSKEWSVLKKKLDAVERKVLERNSGLLQKVEKEAHGWINRVRGALSKQLVGKVGKEGVETALKKIPIAGLAIGAFFAAQRAQAGDLKGAVLELASGIASSFPGIGTAASMGIDAYLLARDIGVIDERVSREEFDRALLQSQNLSQEEFRKVWQSQRDEILDAMRGNPDYYLQIDGTPVRIDEKGNLYDYSRLYQEGLSVNPEGQIYERETGRLRKDVNPEEYRIGRID